MLQPHKKIHCYYYRTDVPLGASGLWLGTRTGAGGTAILTLSFF